MKCLLTPSLVLASIASLGLAATRANAQSGRSPAVIVAMTDTLNSQDAAAILLRSASQSEDVVILKRATASPTILGAALAMLDRLRAQSPTLTKSQVATMQGAVASRPLAGAQLARLNATLQRLAERQTVKIGNLGVGQWVWLANTKSAP